MRAEDFSVWLSGMACLSPAQRREAFDALTKPHGAKAGASSEDVPAASPKKGARWGRRQDALGATTRERVESQGCPHCAGRETVGWGRSHGLSRFRCKSCGRTFNALTKTPMAHLRKKERWLDHARAMIEGKSLAKTAELCGVHATTAFRWRHRFLRASADEERECGVGLSTRTKPFILVSFKVRSLGALCHQESAEPSRMAPHPRKPRAANALLARSPALSAMVGTNR
jgi:transposase-like protein